VTGDKCPKGHYCPQGSGEGIACPLGYYLNARGSSALSACQICTPGEDI